MPVQIWTGVNLCNSHPIDYFKICLESVLLVTNTNICHHTMSVSTDSHVLNLIQYIETVYMYVNKDKISSKYTLMNVFRIDVPNCTIFIHTSVKPANFDHYNFIFHQLYIPSVQDTDLNNSTIIFLDDYELFKKTYYHKLYPNTCLKMTVFPNGFIGYSMPFIEVCNQIGFKFNLVINNGQRQITNSTSSTSSNQMDVTPVSTPINNNFDTDLLNSLLSSVNKMTL